ncbi:MAG: hypothetical protein JXQ30_08065 [Spirochaetes bacterium]|nr:hypothetical protein [Spirochaetota bacterium]
MGKKILIVSLVALIGAALAGATVLVAHDVNGRDVVETGEVVTLEGTLRLEAYEWYLDTDDESYLLHFGNRAYLESTGIDLAEGDRISVDGFAGGSDIAVVSVKSDGETFIFRNTDGTPRWAGRGERYARRDGTRSGERLARGGLRACDESNGMGRFFNRGGNIDGRRMGCRQTEVFGRGPGGECRNDLKPNRSN